MKKTKHPTSISYKTILRVDFFSVLILFFLNCSGSSNLFAQISSIPDTAGSTAIRIAEGLSFFEAGNYSKAIDCYTEGINKDPNNADLFWARALAWERLFEFNHALSDYNKSIALNNTIPETYHGRGLVKNTLKQYVQAIADFDTCLMLNPAFDAYADRGVPKSHLKHYEASTRDFTYAIENDHPSKQLALTNRARNRFELGQYDLAMADLDAAIAMQTLYGDAFLLRGTILFYKKNYEQAAENFTSAIELGEKEAYINRAYTYRELGKYEEAIPDFEKALEQDSLNAQLYTDLGFAMCQTGEFAESIPWFNKAISIDAQLATAYQFRASANGMLGQYDDSIADFDKAILLNPDFSDLYSNRGITKMNKGDKKGAKKDFEKALVKNPDNAAAKHFLAELEQK